jgi:hypothetical protein
LRVVFEEGADGRGAGKKELVDAVEIDFQVGFYDDVFVDDDLAYFCVEVFEAIGELRGWVLWSYEEEVFVFYADFPEFIEQASGGFEFRRWCL